MCEKERIFFFFLISKEAFFTSKSRCLELPTRGTISLASAEGGGGKLDEIMCLEKINERYECRNVQFSGRKLYSLAVHVLCFVKSVFFEGLRDVLSVGFAENIREEAPCIVL